MTVRRIAFACQALAPLLVLLIGACAYAAAQELDAAPPQTWTAAAAAWLTSDEGRIACAAGVYGIVAVLKLVPLAEASGGAKVLAVVALALSAGAAAWGAGASMLASLGTTLAAALGAIGLHEAVGKAVAPLLPLVVAIPKVGAPLAAVLRALLVPSAPTVAEMREDRAAKAVSS